MAEAKVCEKAMSFSKELGFINVEIEGEALTVINKVKNIKKDHSEAWVIISNIHSLKYDFDSIVFKHINRQGNKATHVLAKEGRRFSNPRIWIEDAPLAVMNVILTECKLTT
ncbi:hypothetical protein V6N13_123601 [Hibiscus sabdariffa]|uniref:RNase H type-1 domain-containing protein n=1 Tax=Hibiscus sabdariffa TaxID=183260 RepID=A0ABR2QU55_9ROSI